AFRATLEDVVSAEIILHVRDIANPDTEAQDLDVRQVLGDLGIAGAAAKRIIEVWNKADLLSAEEAARLARLTLARGQGRDAQGGPILVSALTGAGMPMLLAAIEAKLAEGRAVLRLTLDAADGAGLAWLYDHAEVLSRRTGRTGRVSLTLRAGEGEAGRIRRRFPDAKPVPDAKPA
ncbi:MAG: GTPase HflX, partial [Hyphomicrobiales bacterium]|nr:GTPase HflX [Hyphomicrobiales bacterium]